MTTKNETAERDLTGILPIAVGAVLVLAGLWALGHAVLDVTLVAGLSLILYGLGRRWDSKLFVLLAWMVPGVCILLALVGLAAWPGFAMTPLWRVVSIVAALGVGYGLLLFARTNRDGVHRDQLRPPAPRTGSTASRARAGVR